MEVKEIKKDELGYPYLLKHINYSPDKIFVLGNKELLREKSIAIVGSRHCSDIGKKISFKLAYKYAKKGYVIVSGLAKGIDKMAHLGALRANGRTIAVLGSGVYKIYPSEHIELARNILKQGGCIISEHEKMEKAEKDNFPKRNRIISGISEKIIVVESGENSGALITAEYGIEQGKEIYAVIGDLENEFYIGNNKLIQEGATPIIL